MNRIVVSPSGFGSGHACRRFRPDVSLGFYRHDERAIARSTRRTAVSSDAAKCVKCKRSTGGEAYMHTVKVILGGCAALAICLLAGRLLDGADRGGGLRDSSSCRRAGLADRAIGTP
jgi:hypothetical protein